MLLLVCILLGFFWSSMVMCVCAVETNFFLGQSVRRGLLNTVWTNTRINWKIKPLHTETVAFSVRVYFFPALNFLFCFVLVFVAVHLANVRCLFTCMCKRIKRTIYFSQLISHMIHTLAHSLCPTHTRLVNNKPKTTIECYFAIVCSIDGIQYVYSKCVSDSTPYVHADVTRIL